MSEGEAAPRPAWRWTGRLAAAALIAAGLFVSLHYARAAWKADPDIYVSVQLWRGVAAHGLSFLTTWTYTEDNWLLSLIPFTSFVYSVFGASPALTVTLGWVIFVVSVALTAALVWRLAGRWAAALTAGVLLFANYYALGPVGFLTYPISHGISMAWGLAILILAYEGLERRRYALCALAGLFVYVDAISDPWASAAIGVPVILAASAIAALRGRTRLGGCALTLALVSALSAYAAYKHPFHLLNFLRRGHFVAGGREAFVENLRLGYRALALSYNILPGANLDAAATRALSIAALAGLTILAAGWSLWRWRRAGPGRQLVTAVSVLSFGAVAAAYLLGPKMGGAYVARFFPNLFFLGAALAAVAAAEGGRVARGLVAVYAALFVAAGIASMPAMWRAPLVPAEPAEGVGLGTFLRANNLTYGYGQFWGSRALTMETLSGGAVVIRPITYVDGKIAPRGAETSTLWYRPGAEPRGQPLFLHIVPDGSECASTQACEEIARRQFGEPTRRLTDGPDVVLVWDHPLAPLMAPMPQ